jgi:hypothetical protein
MATPRHGPQELTDIVDRLHANARPLAPDISAHDRGPQRWPLHATVRRTCPIRLAAPIATARRDYPKFQSRDRRERHYEPTVLTTIRAGQQGYAVQGNGSRRNASWAITDPLTKPGRRMRANASSGPLITRPPNRKDDPNDHPTPGGAVVIRARASPGRGAGWRARCAGRAASRPARLR